MIADIQRPYYDHFEEIDSFDSYYKNVRLTKDALVIPYINLAFSNHPINPAPTLKYIDFCYLVFKGITFLRTKQAILFGSPDTKGTRYYFGGCPLDNSHFSDFEVSCDVSFAQPALDARLSEQLWIPVNCNMTNLDSQIVENFFRGDMMPAFVKTYWE